LLIGDVKDKGLPTASAKKWKWSKGSDRGGRRDGRAFAFPLGIIVYCGEYNSHN
jgi:hypothetical protein